MSIHSTTQDVLLYFKNCDPVMGKLFKRASKEDSSLSSLQAIPKKKYFEALVRSIVGQQISTSAARSVYKKLHTNLKTKNIRSRTSNIISPTSVMKCSIAELRACGLSPQKASYIKFNAEFWHTIPIQSLHNYNNEEVIQILTELHGVGRWTAEMFLMFSLGRPDVFSYGDLGLMQSLLHNYNLKPQWKRKIKMTVDRWSPYKTYASLALWYSKDNAPLSR